MGHHVRERNLLENVPVVSKGISYEYVVILQPGFGHPDIGIGDSDRNDLIERPRHSLAELVFGIQRNIGPNGVFVLHEFTAQINVAIHFLRSIGLDVKTIVASERNVVGHLAHGTTHDDSLLRLVRDLSGAHRTGVFRVAEST